MLFFSLFRKSFVPSAMALSLAPSHVAAWNRSSSLSTTRNSHEVVAENGRCGVPGISGRNVIAPLLLSRRSLRCRTATSHVCHALATTLEDLALESEEAAAVKEDVEKELSPLTPTASEVQSFLVEICNETSVAEVKVKVGAFTLRVKRDIKSKGGAVAAAATSTSTSTSIPTPAPAPREIKPEPVHVSPSSFPSSSGSSLSSKTSSSSSSSSSSMALMSSATSKQATLFGLLEAAADEGLGFVTSPLVGLFRKGRNAKGIPGKQLCEQGQVIKEGQVVCYLEQLGTQQPVEADISGEVMKVLWEDGEPVGYGDPLIAIRPDFPGIKKLKQK